MRCYDYFLYALLFNTWVFTKAMPVNPDEIVIMDDMHMTRHKFDYLKGKVSFRNALIDKPWANNTLVYSYTDEFDDSDISRISEAMTNISGLSCVEFRQSFDPTEHQVTIQRKTPGCWSSLGFTGEGNEQIINLEKNCMAVGRVQHELLHALGFVHMQCDPKRNEFIEVKFENMKDSDRNNFQIFENAGDFGVGYDYKSIMHYGTKFFSKNEQPTIVPKQQGVAIGQRDGLSPKDILKLNLLYCLHNVSDWNTLTGN